MTSDAPLVLAVEDEPHLQRVLRLTLEANGMRHMEAIDAGEAMRRIRAQRPDLIIVDLGLPDADGIELIRAARAHTNVPILVLSARSQELDKIAALDAGADDYVTMPFSTGELLARLRVGLRHAASRITGSARQAFKVSELEVDLVRRDVRMRGQPVHLTPIEYRLLIALIERAGQVVTHVELLKAGWGPGKLDQQHYLRIYMTGLRRKLEADPAQPKYLLTETGIGYRLRGEVD
jgi:two-component system, OmpR family, KDP operon response regulator KdpE